MLKQDHYEQIEAFLSGQMSVVEQQAFEQTLAQNESLRQALDLHRDMHDSYKQGPKDALRTNLEQIRKEFDDNGQPLSPANKSTTKGGEWWTKWRWGLFALLAVMGIYWYMQQAIPEPEMKDTNQMTTPIKVQPDEQTRPAEIEPPAKETIEETPESSSQEEIIVPSPTQNELPIAANYDPNPRLETEIGSFLRGDFDLEIELPRIDQTLKITQGKASVELRGTLETALLAGDDFSLLLEIYSNTSQDFAQEKYVIQQALLFDTEEAPYEFSQNVQFQADPGLYYYVIKDDFSGAILGGGRLFVK